MKFSTAHPGRRLPLAMGRLGATLVVALAAGLGTAAFAAPGPWGHGGPDGMGPGMHGAWAGRHMLDMVDATQAQRDQIKQIMEAARKDLKPLRESGKQLHQQGQALFAQATLDPNAAEALRQQELALHDQVSKRMLQAMLDAANVLTPAQRQLLGTKLAQREALMAKQHAERAALEGTGQ